MTTRSSTTARSSTSRRRSSGPSRCDRSALMSGMWSKPGLARTAALFDLWNPGSMPIAQVVEGLEAINQQRPPGRDPVGAIYRVSLESTAGKRTSVEEIAVAHRRGAGGRHRGRDRGHELLQGDHDPRRLDADAGDAPARSSTPGGRHEQQLPLRRLRLPHGDGRVRQRPHHDPAQRRPLRADAADRLRLRLPDPGGRRHGLPREQARPRPVQRHVRDVQRRARQPRRPSRDDPQLPR